MVDGRAIGCNACTPAAATTARGALMARARSQQGGGGRKGQLAQSGKCLWGGPGRALHALIRRIALHVSSIDPRQLGAGGPGLA
jgi:hypothetical protein